MNEKVWTKKNIIIISLLIVLAIGILIYKFFIGNNDNEGSIKIVTSNSKFYTVSSCVDRYLDYLINEDSDNLLLLLDKSYKKNNNLNKDNLFSKIDKFDGLYSFEARKMYQEIINDDLTKYYVFGYLINEDIDYDINDIGKPFYVIVYLNTSNMLYSIVPYDGKIFVNGGI